MHFVLILNSYKIKKKMERKMKKQFYKQSNLNTSIDSTILWTFQNQNAINTLLNEGKLIADPIFVSKIGRAHV